MPPKSIINLATVLHRNHLVYPGEHPSHMYHPDAREWWEQLPLSQIEKLRITADLETIEFAERQVKVAEEALGAYAAKEQRVPLLVQLPGCGMLNAITILAAIGTISRFEDAKHLVGYAGLGTSVHDSGMTHRNGRITTPALAPQVQVKPGAKTCVRPWSRWPTLRWTTTPSGRRSLSASRRAWAQQGDRSHRQTLIGRRLACADQRRSRPPRRCGGCGARLLRPRVPGRGAQPPRQAERAGLDAQPARPAADWPGDPAHPLGLEAALAPAQPAKKVSGVTSIERSKDQLCKAGIWLL